MCIHTKSLWCRVIFRHTRAARFTFLISSQKTLSLPTSSTTVWQTFPIITASCMSSPPCILLFAPPSPVICKDFFSLVYMYKSSRYLQPQTMSDPPPNFYVPWTSLSERPSPGFFQTHFLPSDPKQLNLVSSVLHSPILVCQSKVKICLPVLLAE